MVPSWKKEKKLYKILKKYNIKFGFNWKLKNIVRKKVVYKSNEKKCKKK